MHWVLWLIVALLVLKLLVFPLIVVGAGGYLIGNWIGRTTG